MEAAETSLCKEKRQQTNPREKELCHKRSSCREEIVKIHEKIRRNWCRYYFSVFILFHKFQSKLQRRATFLRLVILVYEVYFCIIVYVYITVYVYIIVYMYIIVYVYIIVYNENRHVGSHRFCTWWSGFLQYVRLN